MVWLWSLRRIYKAELASMQDLIGYPGLIAPCSEACKAVAMSKLWTVLRRAGKALEAGKRMRPETCAKPSTGGTSFFSDNFPRYG